MLKYAKNKSDSGLEISITLAIIIKTLMTESKENKHPWYIIILGLFVLIVTILYYQWILTDYVIYHTTVDIFTMYGWVVIFLGSILTIWSCLRIKRFSNMWVLILVFILNIKALLYYGGKLKPLPYQFRFALNNKTNFNLTNLRIIGDQELKLDNLDSGKTLNFVLNEYSENSNIDMIYKLNNIRTDTINLAAGMTNSCGYYYNIDLIIKSGQLTKS